MTKQDKALKNLFKIGGASVYRLSLHSNATLIIDTQSYKACSKSLQIAKILGFRVTHKAARLTLFTKSGKAIQGYRFMARIENPEKLIDNAKIIISNKSNTESIIEALALAI